MTKANEYQVIEGAGTDAQRVVFEALTFTEATHFIAHTYGRDEIDSLGVDILRNNTTEF